MNTTTNHSICCKDLPFTPEKMFFSAESGRVRVENWRGDYLDIQRFGDNLVVKGTDIYLDASFTLTDRNLKITVTDSAVRFEHYYQSGIALNNLMKPAQAAELRKLLQK